VGFFSWLTKKIHEPADQSVLLGDRNRGSEAMIGASSPRKCVRPRSVFAVTGHGAAGGGSALTRGTGRLRLTSAFA